MGAREDVEALAEVILTSYLSGDYNQGRNTPLTRDLMDDDDRHPQYARRYAGAVLSSSWLAVHDEQVRAAERERLAAETKCHCGRPVVYGYDGDPTHHRGMCEACDASRCDAYPLECPHRDADPNGMTRRYLELLRTTDPSPAVLAAIEDIEAELDARAADRGRAVSGPTLEPEPLYPGGGAPDPLLNPSGETARKPYRLWDPPPRTWRPPKPPEMPDE